MIEISDSPFYIGLSPIRTGNREIVTIMKMQSGDRLFYLDWMRVLATIAVFFFHCARFFDTFWWHVKNDEPDLILIGVVLFIGTWLMPTFFLISGISTFHMFDHFNVKTYAAARIKRLLIPFLFGVFFIVPPQVYCERLTHNQFQGSFIDFIPRLFDGLYLFGGNFPWMGLHLWYLLVLVLLSFIMVPLFRWVRSESGLLFQGRVAEAVPHPLLVILLAVPLVTLNILLDPHTAGCREAGGWNLFVYALLFVYGFVVFSIGPVRQSLVRWRMKTLALSLATSVFFLPYALFTGNQAFLTAGYALSMFVRSVCSFSWLITFIGFSARFCTDSNRFLQYANQAVLPFYILHQTIIIIIGYFVVQLSLAPLIKYAIIVPASFIAVMAVYHFIIRPVPLFRFLFGMK